MGIDTFIMIRGDQTNCRLCRIEKELIYEENFSKRISPEEKVILITISIYIYMSR